jgi:hypothetical protein
MRGSKDTVGMPDVRSRRSFFRIEIVRQDQALEMKLEFTPDFYHSEVRAPRGPFFGVMFRHILSLLFFSSSPVAPPRGPDSDRRDGACFATSRQSREIIAPEAHFSHSAFLNFRPDSSTEGERCMKDTVHPNVHFPVHHGIFRRVRSRRSCACHDDQFGRGQNTGLGWSDPTFVHVSVPKVVRGVAPAQLRGDRAECFVSATFRSRGPQ